MCLALGASDAQEKGIKRLRSLSVGLHGGEAGLMKFDNLRCFIARGLRVSLDTRPFMPQTDNHGL